jgi:predicted amidophosphoribosyltransferase
MDLRDLRKAFAERALNQALERCEAGDWVGLDALLSLGLERIPADRRAVIAGKYYAGARILLAQGQLGKASEAMSAAQKLAPEQHLYRERVALLRQLVPLGSVAWRASLQDCQRELSEVCNRTPCRCDSHFKIAQCRGVLGEGFPDTRKIQGVPVHTIGPYYSRSYRGKWTKLLKAIKHAPYDRKPLKAMADIVADFVREATSLLAEVDMIVPIPPSPEKFIERGFAPNDIVAERLSFRLAIPIRKVLVRMNGVATRDASDEELERQFEVRPALGASLRGLSIMLVEDIWTAGRTIPACAEKLRAFMPRDVVGVALGHTVG